MSQTLLPLTPLSSQPPSEPVTSPLWLPGCTCSRFFFQCSTSTQCRLRRIQSREHCSDHPANLHPLPSHLSICPSTPPPDFAAVTHRIPGNRPAYPVAAKPFSLSPAPAALADPESISGRHPSPSFLSPNNATDSASSPQPTYPFPPPGLSKPSSTPSSSKMILPEHESLSCTPRKLELKSEDLLFTPTSTVQLSSSSEPDGSPWSSFRLESFLGNYCHTTNTTKPLSSSPSFHSCTQDTVETGFDLVSASATPRPAHRNKLKDHITMTLNTTPIPTLHPSSSQHLPSSPFSPLNVRHVSSPPVNPFMLQRQRQQAFMSHWNRVRQRNRYTPAMPSFFNPARQEAPGCSWNFLRDPACGGDVNEKLSARRGRESVFERALVKLPLTRCRSSCDRIRQDQQNLLGWGIHAWIGPSKHCRYCINDELIKGFLMFRSHQAEKYEEEMRRRREQQDQSILFIDADEADEGTIDSDAVLLSFPYRTSSSPSPQDYQDQIQNMPTEPFVNYNEIGPANHTHASRSSLEGQGNRSNPNPQDVSAWSAELEKRLLASPVIRDLDDFDLEDGDLEGFDDEDLEGYYDSDEDEESYSSSGSSSPTSDACECDTEPSCRCPRIVIGEADVDDNENKTPEVDVIQQVAKDTTTNLKNSNSSSDKTTTAICGKMLMSFWEEDDDLDSVDCVRVDMEQIDGCVEVDDLSMGMSMGVGASISTMEKEKWMMMKVLEVQVQA